MIITCLLSLILTMTPITVVAAQEHIIANEPAADALSLWVMPPDMLYLYRWADVFVSNEHELRNAICTSQYQYPEPLVIELINDIELSAWSSLIIGNSQYVALVGHYTISIPEHSFGPVISVHSGGKLTLARGITVSRTSSNYFSSDSGNIYVDNGYLTMAYEARVENAQGFGVVLHNSVFNFVSGLIQFNHGGGVSFHNSTFNNFQGRIVNNSGNGVVASGGYFTMFDGWISGNTSDGLAYNGVLLRDNTTFNMMGGTIDSFETGVRLGVGFPLVPRPPIAFDMFGGSIRNNVNGVYVSPYNVFRMMSGAIEDNHGRSGVFVRGSRFYMFGGFIRNNSSDNEPFGRQMGGGVTVYASPFGTPSVFTMFDGRIEKNNATNEILSGNGGGVHIDGSSFIMRGGVICSNTVEGVGGGVGMQHQGSSPWQQLFVMYGGVIENNTARSGGGLFLASRGPGNRIINGTIRNNTATSDVAGGISVMFADLYINNSAIIDNQARNGGAGIMAGFSSRLEITNSTIADNTVTGARLPDFHPSDGSGGGIILFNQSELVMHSGRITGNTAYTDGGGIWANDLSDITIGADVVFSDNQASRAFNRLPEDDALYHANIHATQWTAPFTQGFNNFDISYTRGTPFVEGSRIFSLTIGDVEGVIDQSAKTITFHILNTDLINGRFVGTVDQLIADGSVAMFYVNGQEWPIQEGQLAGFSSGDKVFIEDGIVYDLVIIPMPGRISRLTVGGIEGVVDQEAETITFYVPSSRLVNGRFVGFINEFYADCNVARFWVLGNEWPLMQGQEAGFSSGDSVYVNSGVVYTLIVVPV